MQRLAPIRQRRGTKRRRYLPTRREPQQAAGLDAESDYRSGEVTSTLHLDFTLADADADVSDWRHRWRFSPEGRDGPDLPCGFCRTQPFWHSVPHRRAPGLTLRPARMNPPVQKLARITRRTLPTGLTALRAGYVQTDPPITLSPDYARPAGAVRKHVRRPLLRGGNGRASTGADSATRVNDPADA